MLFLDDTDDAASLQGRPRRDLWDDFETVIEISFVSSAGGREPDEIESVEDCGDEGFDELSDEEEAAEPDDRDDEDE